MPWSVFALHRPNALRTYYINALTLLSNSSADESHNISTTENPDSNFKDNLQKEEDVNYRQLFRKPLHR